MCRFLSETEDDEFELWSDQTEMHPATKQEEINLELGILCEELHAPSCLNWGVHHFRSLNASWTRSLRFVARRSCGGKARNRYWPTSNRQLTE